MRSLIRILTLAAAVSVTVVALAACTQNTALPSLPTSTATATPTPSASAGPTATAIAALALREVGEGTVVSVEDEAAGTEWDVRVVLDDGTVRELHLAADGTLLAGPTSETTDPNEESENRSQVAAAAITLGSAHKRMLAAVRGGRVTEIELDRYQDRVVWQGDVVVDGVRHDVRIDAVNGSVLLDQADATSTPTSGS